MSICIRLAITLQSGVGKAVSCFEADYYHPWANISFTNSFESLKIVPNAQGSKKLALTEIVWLCLRSTRASTLTHEPRHEPQKFLFNITQYYVSEWRWHYYNTSWTSQFNKYGWMGLESCYLTLPKSYAADYWWHYCNTSEIEQFNQWAWTLKVVT